MLSRIQTLLSALLILSLITLSGCADSDTDEAMKSAGESMGKEEPLESKAMGVSEGRTSDGMLPVYFDFDASDIRGDQIARIQVNSDFLKKNGGMNVRIEGNCDPRGTKEYNMALGERRALSAKKYLVNLGISEDSMSTISYGEERILLQGQDELSWAKNRRADFVIAK